MSACEGKGSGNAECYTLLTEGMHTDHLQDTEAGEGRPLGWMEESLWLSFALLGSLIMQNTLVAMMNNTCNRIEEESLVSAFSDDLKRGLP